MDDFDLSDMFSEMEFDTDLELGELDFGNTFSDGFETRYIKPSVKQMKDSQIAYSNAIKLAKEINIKSGDRFDVIVSGDFIFGDFLEAYITTRNIKCRKMTISTLSLSQNNVDSLKNLMVGGFVDELDMIVSHYFYSNERLALIPYIYKELDYEDRFQLSVASVHTKTAQFETADKKIVMHGSANLRSNGNIEQFTIEENSELYDFYDSVFANIKERYLTINKAVRKDIFSLVPPKYKH